MITRMPRRWASRRRSAEVAQDAVGRVDRSVVGDVVAVVTHRRRIEREEPDRGDPQLLYVVEPRDEAGQVAYAVTVGVLERPECAARR